MLSFASFPEPILGRFPEFGPGPIQDLKIVFFFLLADVLPDCCVSPGLLRDHQPPRPLMPQDLG